MSGDEPGPVDGSAGDRSDGTRSCDDLPLDDRSGDDQPVGWSGPVARETFLRWRTPLFALALAVLVAGGLADVTGALDWNLRPLNWLFGAALLGLVAYLVAPLAANRALAARYWRAIRDNRLAVAALGYVAGLFVVGTVGPLVVGQPSDDLVHAYQPPAFTSVHTVVSKQCVGQVVDGFCRGSLAHPLGTNARGADMVTLLVAGARIAVQVALVATMLAVPIGVGVGVLAGYRGGTLDDALMRYVDVQGAIPAFLVYLVVASVHGRSLLLLVVAFGLLNWGGVARLVRSETRRLRSAGFVEATTVSGGGTLYTVRRALLPNVTNSVVISVTREASALVLVEAALAFMKLSEIRTGSWGETIAHGLNGLFFPLTWWISTLPALALLVTVVAFSVLGDALRDALAADVQH